MLHILDTSIKNRATGVVCESIKVQRDIYVYEFSRRFYPKWLCIQVIHVLYVCSLGIEPTTFALLTQCFVCYMLKNIWRWWCF